MHFRNINPKFSPLEKRKKILNLILTQMAEQIFVKIQKLKMLNEKLNFLGTHWIK
jgi:hypothetical protein